MQFSTPLESTPTTKDKFNENEPATPPPSVRGSIHLGAQGAIDAEYSAPVEDTHSDSESPPLSPSSDDTTSTSLTTVTNPHSFHEDAPDKPSKNPTSLRFCNGQCKLQAAGNIVNLDRINLGTHFEYQENPKAFYKRYHDDKVNVKALAAICYGAPNTNMDTSEEIVSAELHREDHGEAKNETSDSTCSSMRQQRPGDAIAKPRHHKHAAAKQLFACASLFDAYDYSIPRQPNCLFKLGNNYVGFDRYRMSATLTREERLQKLVAAFGETLEFSVRYFLEECPDSDATVPGHDDIRFVDLSKAKSQRLANCQIPSRTLKRAAQGPSIQIGFPTWKEVNLSQPHPLSGHTASFADVSSKKHMHHFGLGVFRIDAPSTGEKECKPLSTSTMMLSITSTTVVESISSTLSKERSIPRKMPGLIGDENNRFWPSQRAFSAIPPGHFLAPDRANAFRGLRLERDPRHPRWRRCSAPDPSALYASGPPVAIRRHSEQSAPTVRAASMYKRSWMLGGNESIKSEAHKPQALDGAMENIHGDATEAEEGVGCGEPDADIMLEFPKLDMGFEEPAVCNIGLKEAVIIPQQRPREVHNKVAVKLRDDPLRRPRQVRCVRFQL